MNRNIKLNKNIAILTCDKFMKNESMKVWVPSASTFSKLHL